MQIKGAFNYTENILQCCYVMQNTKYLVVLIEVENSFLVSFLLIM